VAEPEHKSEVAQIMQYITHEYNASRNDLHRIVYETPQYYTSNAKMECWGDLKDALASRIGTPSALKIILVVMQQVDM